jgi:hypothetical protein
MHGRFGFFMAKNAPKGEPHVGGVVFIFVFIFVLIRQVVLKFDQSGP